MPTVLNVSWRVPAGVRPAIGRAVAGRRLCPAVIGIPLGIASLEMVPAAPRPLGTDIVGGRRPVPGPGRPLVGRFRGDC